MSGERVSLREASRRLGLHYMTVYRHVRTGRLPAQKTGDQWEVEVADLERLRSGTAARRPPGRRGDPAPGARVPHLAARLIGGDEPGAWMLVEAAMAAGADASAIYTELFVPVLRLIGDGWERGEVSIADEHRATAVMQRLIGRMGPQFRRRGRSRGSVVLGAPEGEFHALPGALAADLLRGAGYAVVDLGPDVPTASFVDCASSLPTGTIVGVVVTTRRCLPAARRLVRALRSGRGDIVLAVGGAAVTREEAASMDATLWAPDAGTLIDALSSAVDPS